MNKLNSSDFSTLITNRSITVNFNGESSTIIKEDKRYERLLAAIREERWDDVPGLMKPECGVTAASDGEMRVDGCNVYVKTSDGEFEVPTGLNSTILHYIEQKLPFKPLVRFAVNLSQNPSYRSVQQLFTFLEKNNFTITEEGKFIAYKSVRNDFRDVHSNTFDNSVGSVVKMPRNQVDENPDHTCSNGLHVANYDYAHNTYAGPVTLFVEVNPKDVVSVPTDYNNAKIRVCEYKVLGISKGEFTKSIYKQGDENLDESYEPSEDDEEICSECDEEIFSCMCEEEEVCVWCDEELRNCIC